MQYRIGKRSMLLNFNDISIKLFLGDIKLPSRVQEAMQMQVEAERKKRATILESEGVREAEINVAEGKRQSRILQSGKFLLVTSITVSYVEHFGVH